MKKIMTTLFLMAFVAGSSFAQGTGILPQSAQDFVEEHFSDATLEKVDKQDGWFNWDKNEMYEVHFTNGIKLDFDRDGEVTEIDSKDGGKIPEEIIPENILSYVQSEYNSQIISWEIEGEEQDIKLADGTEIEFDRQGNFRKLD